MTFIQENSFSPQSGSRPGVPRVVVLVTDGKSQDDVIPAARSLRDSGVEVFAIGGYTPLTWDTARVSWPRPPDSILQPPLPQV